MPGIKVDDIAVKLASVAIVLCIGILCILSLASTLQADGFYTIIQDDDGLIFETDADGSWSIAPGDQQLFRAGERGAYSIGSDRVGTFIRTAKQNKFYIEDDLDSRMENESASDLSMPKRRSAAFKETRVTIDGNKVLVPVTLGYRKRNVSILLLLDTGASMTAIDEEAAQMLRIRPGKKERFSLADGQVIEAGVEALNYVQVGPVRKEMHSVAIFKTTGPRRSYNGLLGFDFLKDLNYRIDYDRQVIQWMP